MLAGFTKTHWQEFKLKDFNWEVLNYLSKKKNNYRKLVTTEITLLEFFPTDSLSKLAKNIVDEILAEKTKQS